MTADEYFRNGIEKQNNYDYEGAIFDYTFAIFTGTTHERKTISKKLSNTHMQHVDVIETKGASSDYYYNRGICLSNTGKYMEAVDDFTYVIDCNPNDAEAYFKRAIANFALNNELETHIDLGIAYELDSKYSIEAFLIYFSY